MAITVNAGAIIGAGITFSATGAAGGGGGGGGGGGTTTYSHLTGDWTDGFFYSEPGSTQISLNTSLAVLSFYSALEATTTGTIFSVVYNDNTTDTLTQTGSSSYFGVQLNVPVSGFSSGSIKTIKSITF